MKEINITKKIKKDYPLEEEVKFMEKKNIIYMNVDRYRDKESQKTNITPIENYSL